MEHQVVFTSDSIQLSGAVRTPDHLRPGERRPAFIVLHGFGTNSNAKNVVGPCKMLADWGYVTLRFDMRGCGKSGGEPGRLICLEQVSDTKNALTHLAQHPNVDPQRIALLGSSFGAAVSLYTGSVDSRVAAIISSGGWGNGERKFRGQHTSPEAWKKFVAMLEEGRRHREKTGKSLMVDREEIVPLPPHLNQQLVAGSVDKFPAETAQSMFDFRAEDVIGNLAPRPLLLLHSSLDSVTPTSESIELFKRAKQPADLHLFAETDHFMFAEDNHRVHSVVREWLQRYFPV